jgi:hypothetical protein
MRIVLIDDGGDGLESVFVGTVIVPDGMTEDAARKRIDELYSQLADEDRDSTELLDILAENGFTTDPDTICHTINQ